MTQPSTTRSQLKSFLADPRIIPFLNYALLVFMVMTLGMTGVVALIISTFAEDKAPDWIKTHFEFQKRTFWVGIAPVLVTGLCMTVFARLLPGPVIAAFIVLSLVFVAGRCVMGFNHLLYSRAYPNPKAWIV